MVERVVCCLAGYLCGSFLTADAVARRAAGRTVFELGSGNPGMANVGHVLGTRAAAITLAGDLLKVLLPWAALFALWGGDLGQLVVKSEIVCKLVHRQPPLRAVTKRASSVAACGLSPRVPPSFP